MIRMFKKMIKNIKRLIMMNIQDRVGIVKGRCEALP